MNPAQRETPTEVGDLTHSVTTLNKPDSTAIDTAVDTLGQVFRAAFDSAVALDIAARKVARQFWQLTPTERIELADAHPGLVEGLLSLELHYSRQVRG